MTFVGSRQVLTIMGRRPTLHERSIFKALLAAPGAEASALMISQSQTTRTGLR